jgi:hypothetical protein
MAKVRGAKDVRAAIQRAPVALQDEAVEEVTASTKRMYYDAKGRFATAAAYGSFWHGKAGMQNITGTVRRLYRFSVSKKMMRGRVGILSAASSRKAWYLRFFLYGTSRQPARNVHDDAFEAEKDVYTVNQTRALKRVITKVFK